MLEGASSAVFLRDRATDGRACDSQVNRGIVVTGFRPIVLAEPDGPSLPWKRNHPVKKILRFRIDLLGTAPSIWRRIEVPADYTFWDLHVVIQDSMGWTDTHLHAFEVESGSSVQEIGIPDFDADESVVPGWEVRLSEHFKSPGDRIIYEYDFGDSWRHSILLEAEAPAEPGVAYPRCVDGARKCPPEDCGGPYRFDEFLEAISDPSHEEHDELLQWCGGSFDAEEFDPEDIRFDDPDERRKLLELD